MEGYPSTLRSLVRETEGPQPWRKVFHACNALAIVAGVALVDPTRRLLLVVAGTAAALLLAADMARLALPRLNALFFRSFRALASPREADGVASSTWYAVGIFVAALLATRPVLVTSILVLGFADPAAWLVGRRWGRRPFLEGTVEGTAAFFVTALLLVGPRHGWVVGLVAAAITSVAERRSWPLDDNFTIPVVTAGTIALLGVVP